MDRRHAVLKKPRNGGETQTIQPTLTSQAHRSRSVVIAASRSAARLREICSAEIAVIVVVAVLFKADLARNQVGGLTVSHDTTDLRLY